MIVRRQFLEGNTWVLTYNGIFWWRGQQWTENLSPLTSNGSHHWCIFNLVLLCSLLWSLATLPECSLSTYLCCQIFSHLCSMYVTDMHLYFWKHVIHMSIWTLATFLSFDHLISSFLFLNLARLLYSMKWNIKHSFENCFWEDNALPKH